MTTKQQKDDDALWQRAVHDVQPLPQNRVAPAPASKRQDVSVRPPAKSKPPLDLGDRRLLRGHSILFTASLDLHHKTEAQAQEAVSRFVRRQYRHHQQVIRIITGRGKDGRGVLRQNLLSWLNGDAGLRSMVAAVYQASAEDGGEGAFYLFLARSNDE